MNVTDLWNTWVGADYTPEQAVTEARERGLDLPTMARELIIGCIAAHGEQPPSEVYPAFQRALQRAAGQE